MILGSGNGNIINIASITGHPKYKSNPIIANINPFLNVKNPPMPEHEYTNGFKSKPPKH
jgi:hypothetical protein